MEYKRAKSLGKKEIDLTDKVFGKLTVIYPTETYRDGRIWYCECECGGNIYTSGHSLRMGRTRSCGCIGREVRLLNTHDNRTCCKEGTNLGNLINPVLKKSNTSGHNGIVVKHYKTCTRYIAQIMFRRKHYYLGSFHTLEEAVEARKKAEKLLFEPVIAKHFDSLSEHLKKDYFKNKIKEDK